MTATSDKTLFQSVIKMIDALATSGNYDTIIHILSLLCLFSVLNQSSPQQHVLPTAGAEPSSADNPLQKILGSLMKSDGGAAAGGNPLGGALGAALGSPDLLGSLLPLLNNPQVKSKLNPANIASVMGMINNLGGLGGLANLGGGLAAAANNVTQQTNGNKAETKIKTEKKTLETEPSLPASTEREPEPIKEAVPEPMPPSAVESTEPTPPEKKPGNRFLNWKTNF